MAEYGYVVADVFAERPLEGNSLAVLPDAKGLSAARMQAVARETNLSETTFVFRRPPAVERRRGIRTRIFTTREELPFAGHPTLGTAAVLRGRSRRAEIALELGVGRVPVRFERRGGRDFGEMTQIDPTFGATHAPSAVASALGLEVDDLDRSLPIETVSVGNPVALVAVRRLSTLATWRPVWARLSEYLASTDARFFYVVSRETEDPRAGLHARMPFYGGDDPATGSAAGPAVAWLVRHGALGSESPLEIEQGLEAGRPSRLYCRAHADGDRITNLRVGGYTYPVARGRLMIP